MLPNISFNFELFRSARYNQHVSLRDQTYATLCCRALGSPLSPSPKTPESAINEERFLEARCEDYSDDQTEADPILDDLYFRRVLQTLHQTSFNPNFDRFLPRYWTPEEETRVRRIYLGSQKRPWYRKMFGLRSVTYF